jgi:hypothetical protein
MGPQGPQGPAGFSPQVIVTEDTGADYAFEIVTQSGATNIPALKRACVVYNVDLSAPSAAYSVAVGDLTFELRHNDDQEMLNMRLIAGAGTTSVVDVNAYAANLQNLLLVGAVIDGLAMTGGMEAAIGAVVLMRSEENYTVLIRRTNQSTGIAALTEIKIFSSGGGARTTIWTDEIY